MTMTEEQARGWVDKPVYSSDGRNLGEVVALQRDASGKVTEMHADVGGFLGIGETRIKIMPSQFTLGSDRIILTVNADQAKSLPKLAK
jgi:PRC-barrel domain